MDNVKNAKGDNQESDTKEAFNHNSDPPKQDYNNSLAYPESRPEGTQSPARRRAWQNSNSAIQLTPLVLQWLTFGILAVVTGNQNDIAEPPNAKHPTGEELDNRRARSADVKPVNPEESNEER